MPVEGPQSIQHYGQNRLLSYLKRIGLLGRLDPKGGL